MANTLLLIALVVPVALFWLLVSRARMKGLLAAAIAVAAGWAMNVAWAFAAAKDPAPFDGNIVAIATTFGWVCPTVLVSITWLVRRLMSPRPA